MRARIYTNNIKQTNTMSSTSNTQSMTLELAVQRIETLEKQMMVLMADKVKDDKVAKKAKKTAKKAADGSSDEATETKVKKVSGYLLHNAAQRPALKETMEKEIATANKALEKENAKLAEDDKKPLLKLKSTEVLSRLATAWKALDDAARAKWNADAAAANEAAANQKTE